MKKSLYTNILEQLEARSAWENRCIQSYEMRHTGTGRKHRPWPGAADLHYPLADTIIEKMKPFFLGQIYNSELVASFRCLLAGGAAYEQSAAQWFHYQLMEKSNFEIELHRLVDTMLTYGTAVMKSFYDADEKRPSFTSVDPLFLIVPTYANSLRQADWVVHVQQYSKAAYKRVLAYNQDEDFIGRICGRGTDESRGKVAQWTNVKYRREGITSGVSKDQIVVWEVYERDDDGWAVHTVSPLLPDEPIRPSMRLPYVHGKLPFVEVPNEVKDPGFYSARGIVERVKTFEQYATKLFCEKADAITLYNNPLYTPKDNLTPNTANLKLIPGQVLPYPIVPLQMGAPPVSWDQELDFTRWVAEQMVSMPDFGMNSPRGKEPRSATEIANISSLMQQNIGSRARLFKHFIGQLFRLHYELLLQYSADDLNFFYRDALTSLPPGVLHEQYRIEPKISGDNFNKEAQFQKKLMRYQLFLGNPFVDQAALVRSVIEADDPQEVKALFVPPQPQQPGPQQPIMPPGAPPLGPAKEGLFEESPSLGSSPKTFNVGAPSAPNGGLI